MAFLYRLLPPRPTFAQDMSSAEADVMQRHVACWQDLLNRDVALAFGPVLDPEDPWGLGLLDLEASRLPEQSARATPRWKVAPAPTRSCQCSSCGPAERNGRAHALRARHFLLGGPGYIRFRFGEGLLHEPVGLIDLIVDLVSGGHELDGPRQSPGR